MTVLDALVRAFGPSSRSTPWHERVAPLFRDKMNCFVRKEAVIGGDVATIGPYLTESEARMTLANEVERAVGEVCRAVSQQVWATGLRSGKSVR